MPRIWVPAISVHSEKVSIVDERTSSTLDGRNIHYPCYLKGWITEEDGITRSYIVNPPPGTRAFQLLRDAVFYTSDSEPEPTTEISTRLTDTNNSR